MTTITVAIPDERLTRLKEIAARFSVTPEDLVRVSIEELLSRPEESFRDASIMCSGRTLSYTGGLRNG
jgi:predicted transcriptional regulator